MCYQMACANPITTVGYHASRNKVFPVRYKNESSPLVKSSLPPPLLPDQFTQPGSAFLKNLLAGRRLPTKTEAHLATLATGTVKTCVAFQNSAGSSGAAAGTARVNTAVRRFYSSPTATSWSTTRWPRYSPLSGIRGTKSPVEMSRQFCARL